MYLVILGFVSLVFFGIGVFQYRQKDIPVTFYSGESPLDPDCVSDVEAFNKKHGMMWILYAFSWWISQALTLFFETTYLKVLAILFPVIFGFIALVLYHHHLMRVYVKEEKRIARQTSFSKTGKIGVGIVTVLSLGLAGVLMFAGSVSVQFREEELYLSAFMTQDNTVMYEDIESIEYEENMDLGLRSNGIGNFSIQAGDFSSSSLGDYRLYAYTSCKEKIVLHTQKGIWVFNGKDPSTTREYYEKITKILKKSGF